MNNIQKTTFWDFIIAPVNEQIDILAYQWLKYRNLLPEYKERLPDSQAIAPKKVETNSPESLNQCIHFLYRIEGYLSTVVEENPFDPKRTALVYVQSACLWLQKEMLKRRSYSD